MYTCFTIQSCWDSDRLDLGRVGIQPHKDYLSEEGAGLIARAFKMSRGSLRGKFCSMRIKYSDSNRPLETPRFNPVSLVVQFFLPVFN